MLLVELLSTEAFPRAIVVGVFGGAGLVLTHLYSRRGPLVYAPYAALVVMLTWLLARYPAVPYVGRFAAALGGFLTGSMLLYVAAGITADRQRRRLVREGRLPPSALQFSTGVFGHAWRLGFLVAIGSVVSAGVAYVSA